MKRESKYSVQVTQTRFLISFLVFVYFAASTCLWLFIIYKWAYPPWAKSGKLMPLDQWSRLLVPAWPCFSLLVGSLISLALARNTPRWWLASMCSIVGLSAVLFVYDTKNHRYQMVTNTYEDYRTDYPLIRVQYCYATWPGYQEIEFQKPFFYDMNWKPEPNEKRSMIIVPSR